MPNVSGGRQMATKDVTVTARIRGDLHAQIAALAQTLGRSKSWVIGTALEAYVAGEKQYLDAVRRGLADLEAGRVVPHETVRADYARRKRRRG